MLKLKLHTLATWCEELTRWKRPWCWERLKVGGEGIDRGWEGWMVLLTQWTWVWVNSGSWWWTGKPGLLQSMGWQRVNWTELNWSESRWYDSFWLSHKTLMHVILSGEYMFVFVIFFYTIPFSVQFNSVTQLCPTLCDPMNRSTPGLPVHHQLPEFTQTHVHWVCDAIQPSHPLSSPSPPAPNPSQHQSLFQWVNSSHEVAKVLEFQL